MLVGDFNAEESEPCLSQFLYEYNAKNIVKENTCFKNALNPSCIDLFITNSPLSFQNTIAVSNGLSDFHKMVITVMKMSFKKHSPIERHYRDYRYFDRTNLTLYRPNIHRKTPVLESYCSEYISGSINYFLKELHLRFLTGF